jgi:hypothetical protein
VQNRTRQRSLGADGPSRTDRAAATRPPHVCSGVYYRATWPIASKFLHLSEGRLRSSVGMALPSNRCLFDRISGCAAQEISERLELVGEERKSREKPVWRRAGLDEGMKSVLRASASGLARAAAGDAPGTMRCPRPGSWTLSCYGVDRRGACVHDATGRLPHLWGQGGDNSMGRLQDWRTYRGQLPEQAAIKKKAS